MIVRPQLEIPPVIKQDDKITHEVPRDELTRSVVTPTPLIFKFVQAVFCIPSVAVVLGNGDARNPMGSNEVTSTEIFSLHGVAWASQPSLRVLGRKF